MDCFESRIAITFLFVVALHNVPDIDTPTPTGLYGTLYNK